MKQLTRFAAATALVAASLSAQALSFNFSFIDGTSEQAKAGFITAGTWWSNMLGDNVTINMTVGTQALSAGILAQAGSARTAISYDSFKTALTADASTALDAVALSNMQAGSSFKMLINRTADNPNGVGSATTYLDADGSANNSTVRITTANAKALGLGVGAPSVSGCVGSCDALLVFSTGFTWDFDRSNGITSTDFDFVGVAAHEIGHALGFISGVDILDGNSPPVNGPFSSNLFTYVSSLDLFRYSADSLAAGGAIDWSADKRDKFFSVDGGATQGASFSTGVNFGDGRQNSHWQDNKGYGLLDPTAARGELLNLSENDRMAMDVIGWNAVTAVPEPSSYAMFGLGLVGLIAARRRKAKNAA